MSEKSPTTFQDKNAVASNQQRKYTLSFLLEVFHSTLMLRKVHRVLKMKGVQTAIAYKAKPLTTPHTPQSDISRSVNWAAKLLPYTTCLSQALTAQKRLNQNGYDCQFRIGVRKVNKSLDAHAWIESSDGDVLCPLRDVSPFTLFEHDITELGDIRWS